MKQYGAIIHYLFEHGILRFSEIQRLNPELGPRILTTRLRELDQDSFVVRKTHAVVPPTVEDSLTDPLLLLKPIILAMQRRGDAFLWRTNAPIKVQKT